MYKRQLTLGSLTPCRDWGFAGDYVEAMWLMLQQENPDDYLVSTGQTHSISDFLDIAFKHVGISEWRKYIVIDPQFKRPAELFVLKGKNSKARRILKWKPRVKFADLVKMMVDADIKANMDMISSYDSGMK